MRLDRLRALGEEAVRIGYRDVFLIPNFGRIIDIERTVLYLAALVATLAIAEAASVTVPMLVAIAIGVSFPAARLIRRRDPPPLPSMVVDLVLVAVMSAVALPQPWAALILSTFLVVEFTLLDVALRRYAIVALITAVPHLLVSMIALPPAASLPVRLAASSLIIGASMAVVIVYGLKSRDVRKKLEETEITLSTVVSTAPVAIGTVDSAGIVSSWVGSRAAEFGESSLGRNFTEAFSAVPGLVELIGMTPVMGTQRMELAYGRRTYQVTTTPLRPATHGGVSIVAFDVSQQVDARQRLEEMVDEKDRFIATVSHELRTPLTAIIGFGESLEAMLADGDPELTDLASILTQQGRTMAFMVEDLLVAARSEMGRITIRRQSLDLASTVEDVMRAVVDEMAGKTLVLDVDECAATGDPVRVGQIVRNLLTNAARYGGPRVHVSTSQSEGLAMVEVADDGPPIPSHEREQIFQPYERSSTRPAHPQSIGLGLSVCRKLARLMGGDVTYQHDGWSRFVVTLPLAVASDNATPAEITA
jgi:signal transduction histidine kinase